MATHFQGLALSEDHLYDMSYPNLSLSDLERLCSVSLLFRTQGSERSKISAIVNQPTKY